MRLSTRLEGLEQIVSTRRPDPRDAKPFTFDHEAYKSAFDAAVAERGMDEVMGELEATFREALEGKP